MRASSGGHITCVQLLLEKGAHVNHQANFGVACLFGAEKIAHGLSVCIEEHWGPLRSNSGVQQAIAKIAVVLCCSMPEAINSGALLLTLVIQKCLSFKLNDHFLKVLLDVSSIADKAPPAVCLPHAASWLSVTPLESLGLHLNPSKFHVAIKWWLCLEVLYGPWLSTVP
eukprot:Em0001g974a